MKLLYGPWQKDRTDTLLDRTQLILLLFKFQIPVRFSRKWFVAATNRYKKSLCTEKLKLEFIQESLANAKVSMRQAWYIGRNSLNHPHLVSPSNINVIYTSLKSTFSVQQFRRGQCGCIFSRLAVVASQTCQLAQNSEVDDFGTNRKRIYEFLLVINSNFGHILHRFWDTVTYWLKIAYFSYPSHIWCAAPYLPFGISRWS